MFLRFCASSLLRPANIIRQRQLAPLNARPASRFVLIALLIQWLWKLLPGELTPKIFFGYKTCHFRCSYLKCCRYCLYKGCFVQKMRRQNKTLSIMSSTSKATTAALNSPKRNEASVDEVRSCHIQRQSSISPQYYRTHDQVLLAADSGNMKKMVKLLKEVDARQAVDMVCR